MKVNILGSCVSRLSLLNGNKTGHGIADDGIELGYFLDKQNIACAMTPPPFKREEVEAIQASELWDTGRIQVLKQCLNKDTINLLMESDAQYLVLDLYDMQNDCGVYQDTFFSTCAHEFFRTKLAHKYQLELQTTNLMKLPTWLWYGYVDLFFETIMKKYDAQHIILLRFRSNTYYLTKQGTVEKIPENFKQPFHSNDKYNGQLEMLENYIIKKYDPYVIDLAKYYMGNENEWNNLNGAYFEREFYQVVFTQIKKILFRETNEKYYSKPPFFEQERVWNQKPERLNVDQMLTLLEKLVDDQDILWMNLLDKLNCYQPENDRVKQYMQIIRESYL